MITLEMGTQRVHGNKVQFFVEGAGLRTDDMVTFDGERFSSNGGQVDWDEIENADEAADTARAAVVEMKRYETQDCEDAVEITSGGTFTTYTRGTRDPLYSGPDEGLARKSLDFTPLQWEELLLSDSVE